MEKFAQTKGGHEFLYGTMPTLTKNTKALTEAVKENNQAMKELAMAVSRACSNTLFVDSSNKDLKERFCFLIGGVINYLSVNNSIAEQIDILKKCGFEDEDLIYFGYSLNDLQGGNEDD